MWRSDNSKFGKIKFEEYSQIMKERYAWVSILILDRQTDRQTERERERERERGGESGRLSFLWASGNSIICKINAFFHLNSLT